MVKFERGVLYSHKACLDVNWLCLWNNGYEMELWPMFKRGNHPAGNSFKCAVPKDLSQWSVVK